jgi:hypothetical protein
MIRLAGMNDGVGAHPSNRERCNIDNDGARGSDTLLLRTPFEVCVSESMHYHSFRTTPLERSHTIGIRSEKTRQYIEGKERKYLMSITADTSNAFNSKIERFNLIPCFLQVGHYK